jgi:hypothetical protein
MENKVDRLDNAFLFALSSIGLLISFIQIRQENLSGLIEAIPFLLLGIVLPFYVGYMRGAIEKDSIGERIRGWIYLITGTISYFAIFISSWLRMNYPQFLWLHSQILLTLLLTASSFLVYALIKWTRRVFSQSLNQYALSGTALSAFSFAFVLTMIISLYHDYSVKDLLAIVSTGSTELLFWITIVLASSLIVMICEKASADASERDLPLPQFHKRVARITNFFLVKGLYLGIVLMEYTIDFNLKARLLWLLSYALWFTGSLFWVARVSFLPLVFFILTTFVASFAAAIFYRTKTIDFLSIENRYPVKTPYCLIASCVVITMIFAGFSLILAVSLVIFTVLSLFSAFKNVGETRADGQT